MLSNINALHAENIHASYGSLFDSLFDARFSSYEIKALKPTPEAFEPALAFLHTKGITKTELIFIDDMKENIKAAESLSLSTVHYPMNGQEKDSHVSLRATVDTHIPLNPMLSSVFFNPTGHINKENSTRPDLA